MKVSNVKTYDLSESVKASKYPMAIDPDIPTDVITETVEKLAQSQKGEGHDQFLTGCLVAFDLRCSNKMWVEMERYRFVYFVSSQSTMHRASKFKLSTQCNKYVDKIILRRLEEIKQEYLDCDPADADEKAEKYLKLLYNLPSGFELTARLTTNYRALKTIYGQRKNHRLPEWHEFCRWIETLPHSEFIVGKQKTEQELAVDKAVAMFKQKLQTMSNQEQADYLNDIGLKL